MTSVVCGRFTKLGEVHINDQLFVTCCPWIKPLASVQGSSKRRWEDTTARQGEEKGFGNTYGKSMGERLTAFRNTELYVWEDNDQFRYSPYLPGRT